jgi:hypothetical protein
VRVIHRGYQEFLTQGAAYIPIDRERNTKFLSLRTSTTLDWTNNIAENSQVQNAKGENGYTNITVTWDRASGSYAGYKILYRKFTEYDGPQSLSSFQFTTSIINTISSQGTNDANMGIVTCLNQTNPSPCENNQKTISNLTPGSWYHIKIFICELTDTSCPLIKPDGNTLSKSYDQKYIHVKP